MYKQLNNFILGIILCICITFINYNYLSHNSNLEVYSFIKLTASSNQGNKGLKEESQGNQPELDQLYGQYYDYFNEYSQFCGSGGNMSERYCLQLRNKLDEIKVKIENVKKKEANKK